jgi:two-component system chemotaxis response regulator CheB
MLPRRSVPRAPPPRDGREGASAACRANGTREAVLEAGALEDAEMKYEIVVIGTSWGGLNALSVLLERLPSTFPLPIVVVQHRGKSAHDLLAQLLQQRTLLRVREAEDKEPIAAGTLYLAPPDYHLLVDRGAFVLSTDEPVNFSRPSIDLLFESAAGAYGRGVIGVVLTGANQDGASGLKMIKDAGGYAIVQEPSTAESSVMPKAAVALAHPDQVAPLEAIAEALVRLARDAAMLSSMI